MQLESGERSVVREICFQLKSEDHFAGCAIFSAYCLQCSRYDDSWIDLRSTTLLHSHEGASRLFRRFRFRSSLHFFRSFESTCRAWALPTTLAGECAAAMAS